jgi:hypothetical protein
MPRTDLLLASTLLLGLASCARVTTLPPEESTRDAGETERDEEERPAPDAGSTDPRPPTAGRGPVAGAAGGGMVPLVPPVPPAVVVVDGGAMQQQPPPNVTPGSIIDARTVAGMCPFDPQREPQTLAVPTDYATIQEAIDLAEPRDVVLVAPGVYREHLRLRTYVKVIGGGAKDTILDGGGEAKSLVDFSGAYGAQLSGFTLRNVGQGEGCANPQDVQLCAGDWYSAAIYGDGKYVTGDPDPCDNSTITVTANVIEDNDIGMMLYFLPYADVRDNVFARNRAAFVVNAHASGFAEIRNNVFYGSTQVAVSVSASYLDLISNVFVKNAKAFEREYVQEGRTLCNVLFENDHAGDLELGTYGKEERDPLLIDPENGDFGLDEASPARSVCSSEILE